MAGGDAGAADKLFVVLYDNLRNQARRAMHKQPKGHTLQATALVHEAFLKLLPGSRTFKDRAH